MEIIINEIINQIHEIILGDNYNEFLIEVDILFIIYRNHIFLYFCDIFLILVLLNINIDK